MWLKRVDEHVSANEAKITNGGLISGRNGEHHLRKRNARLKKVVASSVLPAALRARAKAAATSGSNHWSNCLVAPR